MKDMDGTPIKEGDMVRVHVWGSDKRYHPVGKILRMDKPWIGPTKVLLQWIKTGDISDHTYNRNEISKVELEDLI